MPFHERTQRWACLVAHRRYGKTVGVVNDIIMAAMKKAGPYAYIAPYRSQAKSVAWDYVKFYGRPVLRGKPNEADLKVNFINGSSLQLFGADNADAMRGLGFAGVSCDEYGDFRPSVWGNVIRPTLSDRKGWAVFMGTPKGHNQFYDIYRYAKTSAEWFVLTLKASETGILPKTELEAARAQLSEDQYAQEYECSFDAAILGAFYGKEMARVDREGRICAVPHDPAYPVYTAWDIGRTDDTAIWWYQLIANEVHVLDWYAESGGSIEEFIGDSYVAGSLTKQITERAHERGYRYARHWLPHDARAKTLASDGKSVIEKLAKYLGLSTLAIAPNLSVEDGIEAVRTLLGRCVFDHKCNADSTSGVEALRQYQREYNEDSKAFIKTPKHDWTSHSCFTGDTLVLAHSGIHQIMNLPYGGRVLTSCGWKQYENPRITRRNAQLVEVVFVGGYTVKCTPDHLFKTESGWKSAESLTPGMPIQSGLIPSRNISTAGSIVSGRRKYISAGAVKNFIVRLGRWLSVPFRMDVIYTTEIVTQPITYSPTLNAFQLRSTCHERGLKTMPGRRSIFPRTQDALPLHGMPPKLESSGIDDTQRGRSLGRSGDESRSPALRAGSSSNAWSVLELGARSIAAISARPLIIASVRPLPCRENVWCLTVPDAAEFSLSNGAIVHNCDAFRMLAVAERRAAPAAPLVDRHAEAVRSLAKMIEAEQNLTLDELWAREEERQAAQIRI